MTYAQLLDYIDLYIKTNGTKDITGAIDNDVRKTLAAYFEDGKVNKETGKGLSDENYTLAEKNKLSNIEDGAEVNRDFGTAATEVRPGNHVHYKYLGSGSDAIDLIFTSDDKLITHLSYANAGDVILNSIAAGEEGQLLTIFATLRIDLSICEDIETTISELTAGSNGEVSNITFMYMVGLWRQVGLVQYS